LIRSHLGQAPRRLDELVGEESADAHVEIASRGTGRASMKPGTARPMKPMNVAR
jgi:hypothetical protein